MQYLLTQLSENSGPRPFALFFEYEHAIDFMYNNPGNWHLQAIKEEYASKKTG
jgi:hypothetical protein